MPGSKTVYLAQKMLEHCLGSTPFTKPTTVYLALSLSAFDPLATGTAMNEVVGGSYARKAVPNDSTTWTAGTAEHPSEKHNIAAISFVTATAAWGSPQSVYISDAATAGNLLYGVDITNPQAVNSGDIARMGASTLMFNEA